VHELGHVLVECEMSVSHRWTEESLLTLAEVIFRFLFLGLLGSLSLLGLLGVVCMHLNLSRTGRQALVHRVPRPLDH
jgi:hypothetical protein